MLPYDTLQKILSIAPFLVALAFLAASAWILSSHTPLLLRSVYMMALIPLAFLPTLGVFLYIALAEGSSAICMVILILLILITPLAIGIWRLSPEYSVIGVPEEALRQGIKSALEQLALPYQEAITGFSLPTLNDTLQMRFSPWMNTAQIRMRSRTNFQALKEIAGCTRNYLADEASPVVAVIYGVIGVVCLLLGFYQYNRG